IVQSIFEDRDGTIWIGTPSGVSQYKNDQFIANALSDLNLSILAISQDQSGAMWFGTAEGLISLTAGIQRRFTNRDGLPANRINCLLADNEGTLWIGTPEGLSRKNGGRFENLDRDDVLASDPILSLFEDREGSVWVGTSSVGLSLIKNKKFVTYTTKNGLA